MPTSTPPLAADSLAFAMVHAAQVCLQVRQGHALSRVLTEHSSPGIPTGARGAIQDLAYRTMRERGRADAVLRAFVARAPKPVLLSELLTIAIVLLDSAQPADDPHGPTGRYAPYTVVDQAVTATAGVPSLKPFTGLVNAVLRAILRQPARVSAAIASSAEGQYNYPRWWIERVRAAYPDLWRPILDVGQHHPPLTLRVNRRESSVEDYLLRLQAEGFLATRIGPFAVRLARPQSVERIPGFAAGTVSVQDEAAQRAAPLLDVCDGQRVLDACAAPGGKSTHLLELARLDLTVLDRDATRLSRVQDNLDRLHFRAHPLVGDASQPETWWDRIPYDRILADLPCTASGIVRRHPDVRWLRRESDIAALSRQQQQILAALWRLLKPGGKLLIVTCSIFPEEGTALAQAFASRHDDAVATPSPGQLLPCADPQADHDGLFLALFQKNP